MYRLYMPLLCWVFFLYDTEGLVQCFTSSIMARENTAEATRMFYCLSCITKKNIVTKKNGLPVVRSFVA